MTLTTKVLSREEGTSFRLTVARAAEATAPVIVVQPAMGMGSRYYEPFAEALAAAGMHAVLVEQRGHEAEGGRLPGRRYDFGYADLLDDLEAALGVVREELPGAPVHLLGHSLGGQLAIMYAATHPGELAGLVLVASSTPYWRNWGRGLLMASYLFPATAAVRGHFPGSRFGFAGREARRLIREWGRLARTDRFPVGEDRLGEVGIPVLSISVEGDKLGPVGPVDAMVAKLPAARVTREHLAVDGIDHNRWARRPETVVPLLAQWLASGVRATP